GYGKERYFWSLLAAVSIFASGALFAFVEGIRTLISGEHEGGGDTWINYAVLGLAFLLEGTSWLQAVRQVRRESTKESGGFWRYLRYMDDPTPKTVLFEDSAALIGLLLAFAGTGLHQITGSSVWDGIASLLIGVLLALVAYALGYSNRGLLIGRQADPRLWQAIRGKLAKAPEVEAVVDVLTMLTGADQMLLCARLDFDDKLGAHDLELASVRLHAELHEEFPDLDEIFLEPIPRTDSRLRERVLARYGRLLNDQE
ncbi:MAG: cation diffusion facilitator family transporter, partial [Sciscionella sp.]